jgi:hypothetical protein
MPGSNPKEGHGTPSGCLQFDAAVLKAERAHQAALRAAGLTPAQATEAARKYLEAVITAGTLHEVATPDEVATLRELNLERSTGGTTGVGR